MSPGERGFAPIDAGGVRYWLSHHAAGRALEMQVPLTILPDFIRNGERFDAPQGSKYRGRYIIRNGKVSLAVSPSAYGPVIVSVLWATAEAWASHSGGEGREFRGLDETERALEAWMKS